MTRYYTIPEMNLEPNVANAAYMVLDQHPSIKFTSGRRELREQAEAMANNSLLYGTKWLSDTYRNVQMVEQLRDWVSDNAEIASSLEGRTDGFYKLLMISPTGSPVPFPHCLGLAFDGACPRLKDWTIDEHAVNKIKETIENLPDSFKLQFVLTKEGKHRVIHAQFAALPKSTLI